MRRVIVSLFFLCACYAGFAREASANDTLPLASTVTVGDIVVSGNKRTKIFIVMREVSIRKGDKLTKAQLARELEITRQQLMNTSLFVDVITYVNTNTNANTASGNETVINIDLKERWYFFPTPYFKLIDRNFNQWWVQQHRSLERVNYGLKFIQNNFTGRNDDVDIWLITGYTQQITLRYNLPFFDRKLKSGINVGFVYATQKELNYATGDNKQLFFKQEAETRSALRFDATYSYRPDVKQRHYFRVSYNNEQVADTILKINPNYFPDQRTQMKYVDFSYQYKYYNVDYISYPTTGFLFEGNLYKRGTDRVSNTWQLGGRAVYVLPLTPTHNSFLHLEALGSVRTPSSDAFFNQRLFGYGYFQLRGLEYNVVDGSVGAALKTTLHQKLLSFVLKNPFPSKTHDKFPIRIYMKAYSDLGYGYMKNPIAGNTLNNTVLRTWGFGLDIVSVYDFVFKIEYSFNQLGRDGLYLQTRNDF